ncbi:hypothetical protein [Brevibacterium spongiae]|uniref:DNA primase n=1 Tax=Brevibacterium spongiae TaxID=2909672 RepID=A0ABY5SMJ9_9MICO|nr:hypothetical protein [Brevibacterium spongiae]UVI35345.1 hypothetical protein L1F31_14660 [Brevibacterium spongiae]
MNNKMKITGLILAGYMLGRTKKLGLALTVASAVAGTTAAKNRDQLLGGLKDFADSSPELKSLQEKITGRLAESGKSAVKAVAAKGVDQLSVKLQDQTEKMKSTLDDAADSIDPNVDDSEGADDEEDAPESEAENAAAPSEGSEPDEEGLTEEAESTGETETTDEPQETDEEPQDEEEAPKKKPAAKRPSTANRSAKGTRSSKSSTASRGSRTKSGSKRSTTAKKTSSTRAAAKPEEAEDE